MAVWGLDRGQSRWHHSLLGTTTIAGSGPALWRRRGASHIDCRSGGGPQRSRRQLGGRKPRIEVAAERWPGRRASSCPRTGVGTLKLSPPCRPGFPHWQVQRAVIPRGNCDRQRGRQDARRGRQGLLEGRIRAGMVASREERGAEHYKWIVGDWQSRPMRNPSEVGSRALRCPDARSACRCSALSVRKPGRAPQLRRSSSAERNHGELRLRAGGRDVSGTTSYPLRRRGERESRSGAAHPCVGAGGIPLRRCPHDIQVREDRDLRS